jgi:two-component system, cell cycle sensor histidine kinase and response regulator CckA
VNPIAILNVLSILAISAALVFLIRGWKRSLDRDTKILLVGLLALRLAVNLNNALEWGGVTVTFDIIEDNLEILEPVLWVFFFYAFLKAEDISERKRTMAALRASEERYRTLFGDSPIPIWEEDFSPLKLYLDRRRDAGIDDFRAYFEAHPEEVPYCASLIEVVNVNDAAVTLYGAESKDELLRSLDVVFTEDAYNGFAVELIAIAQGREWVEVEAVNRTLNGERKHIIVTWRVIPGYEDSLARCIVSIRDVTEQKRMEAQLRQQEQLAAIGQLAAGIAHDFRNRLAPILLYAQMDLTRRDLPPHLAEHLQVIIQESKDAADLVQQILDFSSRSMIDRQPLDLHACIAEVLENVLRPGLPENIELTLEVAPGSTGPFPIRADRGRIQQVLTNLAVNARDAMSAGGALRFTLARMEIHAGEVPPVAEMQPGEWIHLSVMDTGTGIEDAILPHIFEPFFTTKAVDQGKGLGLPQVYGILRQHGGSIDVATVLGKGTTFHLYLPVYRQPVPEGEEDSSGSLLRGHGETILFVEDHQALREAGGSILTSLGYRVVVASDGREALRAYRARRQSGVDEEVDLLVTDLVMPEMGGEALLRALQQLTPDIRALAVTGHGLEEEERKALHDLGFRAVVHKPFDFDVLAQAIGSALNGRSE